jgi:AhpD family alkylhydroperoxidase
MEGEGGFVAAQNAALRGPSGPMSVVSLVERDQAPLLAAPYYRDAGTSPIVTSLAHVPEALDVTLPFVSVVLGPSAIDGRTKELVIVRTSALLECRYCVQTHSAVALDHGVTAAEIGALRSTASREPIVADDAERALLAWVDAVAAGRGAVADELAEALQAHWTEAEIVELTLLCAATVMLNRYCSALRLPTSPDTLRRLEAEGLR